MAQLWFGHKDAITELERNNWIGVLEEEAGSSLERMLAPQRWGSNLICYNVFLQCRVQGAWCRVLGVCGGGGVSVQVTIDSFKRVAVFREVVLIR